jgi:transposase InsO family protein
MILCRHMGVISQRVGTDMAVLAHIREPYSLSVGSYGRPRMTIELKEAGLNVGERRVGRLMRINGIKLGHTRRHKATTDSLTAAFMTNTGTVNQPITLKTSSFCGV